MPATKTAAEYRVDIRFRCETGVSAQVTRIDDPRRSYFVQLSVCGGGIRSCTCPSGVNRPHAICRHMRETLANLEATR